jgi:hypothetical protein
VHALVIVAMIGAVVYRVASGTTLHPKGRTQTPETVATQALGGTVTGQGGEHGSE